MNLHLVPSNLTDAYAVPARMVHEIALGAERPHLIAARYGYDDAAYFALLQQPLYLRLIDAKRAELAQDGSFFRYKSALLAEANLDFFGKLVHDPNTTPQVRIELHKILMRGARLDGNDAALQVTAGTGTTINILHPGAVPPPPPGKHDLQGTAIPVDPEVLALNHDLDTPVNVASAPTAATSEHRAALPTVKRRAGRPRTATLAATPAPDPAASTNSPPPALVPPVIRIG